MQYTSNIGGQFNMYSRYYIKGGKLYCRYNRKISKRQKPTKALRSEEVQRALFIQKLIIVVTISAIVSITACICLTIAMSNKRHDITIITSSHNSENKIEESKDFMTRSVVVAYSNSENAATRTNSMRKNIYQQNKSETYQEVEEAEEAEEVVTTDDDYYVTDLVYRKTITEEAIISLDGVELKKMSLPDVFYGDIDYSSFQPMEPYQMITNTSSPAYEISHGENAYTDENGLRRSRTNDSQFTVNGEDDYIVALGTYYKTKGTAGERFLVETTTGSFTIITGDEKADKHTDQMNMFTTHCNGKKFGIIEFIIDENAISSSIMSKGTPMNGPDENLSGEITAIYKIL